jgi:hypothetical protein
MAVKKRQIARELDELIAALDRRVPQLERPDESAIADDAAVLRAKAVDRIAELRECDAASQAEPDSNTDRHVALNDLAVGLTPPS